MKSNTHAIAFAAGVVVGLLLAHHLATRQPERTLYFPENTFD